MLNILYLYDTTQMYTNTVYEHIACFGKYSEHRPFFCHQAPVSEFDLDLSRFDAVGIHYSIRLPFDLISLSTAKALAEFNGLKFLFVQDEYDHTHRAWHWIKTLGLHLVFTVVPADSVERIYPAHEFPDTRFITILTGYVPDDLSVDQNMCAPSKRSLMIGYRDRPLPIRYGRLGIEKVRIGEIVKAYCDAHRIKNNIAWSEKSRIYGPDWYEFIVSCRSMLGSESGSNVFDWDGRLVEHIALFRKLNPRVGDVEVYERFVRTKEIEGIMSQVSPRVFEAIAAKTVLVLFEGNYSGVIKANEHFIPVKKDGSNLADVIHLLQNDVSVDAMAERAWQDVIASGKYSYRSFVNLVEEEIVISLAALGNRRGDVTPMHAASESVTSMTTFPIRARLHQPPLGLNDFVWRFASYLWLKLPESVRLSLAPWLKRLLGKV